MPIGPSSSSTTRLEELTGYNKKEFNSRRLKWSDLILQEDLADQAGLCPGPEGRQRLSPGIPHPDQRGRILWIQARGQIVFNPDGTVNHVSGVFYDITELKQAEEALRQSEARLAKAQRLAHLGNWEWDLQSGDFIWSEEVYRIFGVDPQKFTPSLESFLNFVHPEDQARVRKCLNDALAGVRPYNLVNRLIRPDGSVRYIHAQAEVIFRGKRPAAAYVGDGPGYYGTANRRDAAAGQRGALPGHLSRARPWASA